MPATAAPPQFGALPVDSDASVGMLQLGTYASSVLYGLLCAQVFKFSQRGRDDPLWAKIIVVIIWIAETLHVALVWANTYDITTIHFGQKEYLDHLSPTISTSFLFAGIATLAAQAFFSFRIWTVTQWRYVSVLLLAGALARTLLFVAIMGFSLRYQSLHALLSNHRDLLIAAFVIATLVDSTDSIAMVLNFRNDEALREDQSTVHSCTMWCLLFAETGIPTSILAFVLLVLALAQPGGTAWLGIFAVYVTAYSNCMLSALNSCDILQEERTPMCPDTFDGPMACSNSSGKFSYGSARPHTPIEIVVSKYTQRKSANTRTGSTKTLPVPDTYSTKTLPNIPEQYVQ